MTVHATLSTLARTYSLPTKGNVDWPALSRYLRDLSTVVNSISSGSLATPTYNVKNYGAVGDGTANDTVAILAAETALALTGNAGGSLYFPSGTYKYTQSLGIGVTTPQKNVRLVGDGISSVLKPTGAFSSSPCVEFRNCDYWRFSDLRIDASARTGTGDNILIDSCSYGRLTDSSVINATGYGVRLGQVSGSGPSSYNFVLENNYSGNASGNIFTQSGSANNFTVTEEGLSFDGVAEFGQFGTPNLYDAATGITAHAGGGQGSATALAAEINFVTTVATAADSVKLPAAALGRRITVFNQSSKNLNVYPVSGSAINALGINVAYSVPPLCRADFFGTSSTQWYEREAPKPGGFYDIRDYGALPGASGKTATTAAFNAIFAEISWQYFPNVDGKRTAVIYVPSTDQDGWYVGDVNPYVGSPGAGIRMFGDTPSGRSGVNGSTLIYDGTDGGTLLEFRGINGSTFENLTFNGNLKALKVVQCAQKWYGSPNNTQVGSSGVKFINCFFCNPKNEYASILVAAGSDDDPPNTLQSSEYSFFRCFFSGVDFGAGLTRQGWGFKALQAGNTKNFVFENCTFNNLYRGIECYSGYLIIKDCNGANIGYDRGDAAMIYAQANTLLINGGGMENGNTGYAAKFLNVFQGTCTEMVDVYVACTPPGDDYGIQFNGPTKIVSCDLVNGRTAASAIAWAGSTAVLVGQERKNSGKLYRCITAGTTASSGGPTTTSADITDGTAHWRWITSELTGNVFKISGVAQESSGWGGLSVEGCSFPCQTTPVTGVPVYDGNGNFIWGSLAKDGSDYAKTVSHKVRATGCATGVFGGDINIQLPDFTGSDEIVTRDQFGTDGIATGITVQRNANGVYVIVVPASVVAAAAAGQATIGHAYAVARLKITDAIVNVTTAFSGPGVSGIQASMGITGNVDSILNPAAIDSTGVIGDDTADRGTEFADGRYFPAGFPGSTAANLVIKVTASGGAVSDINAGSMTIYLEGKRLGV